MKEDTITLPLGFRFVVGNDIVEVQQSVGCHGCACYVDNGCTLSFSRVECSSSLRSDEINVSFVKVGEVKP